MAIKKNEIDVSTSIDNFGNFDFPVDASGAKRNEVARPSRMRSDYIPAMAEGFTSGLKKELSSKLPYTAAAVDEITSIFSESRNMLQNFSSEAAPLVRSIGRSTNRLMPVIKPFLPKGAYNWITGKLSTIPEEQGEVSEEERRNQQIAADINAAMQGADASAQVRDNMQMVVGAARHKETMGAFSQLSKQMQYVNNFLSTTMTAYMKKDLELQFRQLYTLRDISSVNRLSIKIFETELKNITHNTGLPETIKMKDFEKRTTRREKLSEYNANFWKKFMTNIKTNLLDQIKEGLEGAEQAASMAAEGKDIMESMGEKIDAKKWLVNQVFKFFGGKVGSKVGGRVAGMLKNWTNIESGAANVRRNVMRGTRKYADTHDGFLSWFIKQGLPDEFQQNLAIQNDLANNPTKAVQFDISTREAIVKIIPGYLSKTLAAISKIQNPEGNASELVYDASTREFVAKESLSSDTGKAAKLMHDMLNPQMYEAQGQLKLQIANRIYKGEDVNVTKKWLETKDKSGVTNREKVTRVFVNISRIPGNDFNPNKLEEEYNNRNLGRETSGYWIQATEGITNSLPIVKWILDSLRMTNGQFNQNLINKYQNLVDRMAEVGDVNVISERFSSLVTDGSTEVGDSLVDFASKTGFFDRERGTLNKKALSDYQAAALSKEDLDFGKWTTKEYAEDIVNSNAQLTFNDFVGGALGWAGKKIDPIANRAKMEVEKIQDQMSKIGSKIGTNLGYWASSTTRQIFGDDALKAFEAMSDAFVSRYKSDGGMQILALDIAMNSESIPQEDKDIIRGFMDQAMEVKNDADIQKYRIVVIGKLKHEAIRNIFAEATEYMTTRKEAINAFGNIEQRWEMLKSEEHVEKIKTAFKDGLNRIVDRSKQAVSSAGKAIGITPSVSGGAVGITPPSKLIRAFASVTGFISGKKKRVSKETEKMIREYAKASGKTYGDAKKEIIAQAEKEAVDKQNTTSTPSDSTENKASLLERGKEKAKLAWEYLAEKSAEITLAMKESVAKPLETYFTKTEEIGNTVNDIYLLLKKKYGKLTKEEKKALAEGKDLDEEETKKPKGPSFLTKLKVGVGAVLHSLNPFKADARMIAAKFQLDPKAVMNRFHADFQRYFEYRKEMDILMAGYMKNNTFFGAVGNASRGFFSGGGKILGAFMTGSYNVSSAFLKGSGNAIGGVARSLFYKVKGKPAFFDVYGKDDKGSLIPLLSEEIQAETGAFIRDQKSKSKKLRRIVCSSEINGPVFNETGSVKYISVAAMKNGLFNKDGKDIHDESLIPTEYAGIVPTIVSGGVEVSKMGYDFAKESAKLGWKGTKFVAWKPFKWGYNKIATWKDNKEKEKYSKQFLDLYIPNEKGDGLQLILSAKDQASGIIDDATSKPIHRTIDINGPVRKDGKIVISNLDIQKGLQTFDGVKISELAIMNTRRGNTFKESMGEGFKNFTGFLRNTTGGIGKIFDIGKIFAGAGGAVLQGGAAVGLHALDFGLNMAERLFGFEAMSEKKFEKKYKPLLSRMDVMSAYLKSIEENTRGKKTEFDEDNNGMRDNAAASEKNYANQTSRADTSRVGIGGNRPGEKKEEGGLFGWLKNPKGIFLTSLTHIAALLRPLKTLKGILGAASALVAGWGAINGYKWWAKYKKEGITEKNAKELGELHAKAELGIRGGQYITEAGARGTQAIKGLQGASAAASTASAASGATNVAHGVTDAAGAAGKTSFMQKFLKIFKPAEFKKAMAVLAKKFSQYKASIKAMAENICTVLKNMRAMSVSELATGIMKVITGATSVSGPLLQTAGTMKQLGEYGKGFAEAGKGAGSMIKGTFSLLTSPVKGVAAILGGFVGFMKGLLKTGPFLELVVVALDTWTTKKLIEEGNAQMRDEYEEGQNTILGWSGKILGWVMTGGRQFGVDMTNKTAMKFANKWEAENSAKINSDNAAMAQSKYQRDQAKKQKDAGREGIADRLNKLDAETQNIEVDVSDQLNWLSGSDAKAAAQKNEIGNIRAMLASLYKSLTTNPLLLPKAHDILADLALKAFKEQKAYKKETFGFSHFDFIRKLANAREYTAFSGLVISTSQFDSPAFTISRDYVLGCLYQKGVSKNDLMEYAQKQWSAIESSKQDQVDKKKVAVPANASTPTPNDSSRMQNADINLKPNDVAKKPEDKTSSAVKPEAKPVVDTKDKLIDQMSERISFLEELVKGNGDSAEYLKQLVALQGTNNDLVAATGENQLNQTKSWKEQYAKLKKAQAANASLLAKANAFGQNAKPKMMSPLLKINQGFAQGN